MEGTSFWSLKSCIFDSADFKGKQAFYENMQKVLKRICTLDFIFLGGGES